MNIHHALGLALIVCGCAENSPPASAPSEAPPPAPASAPPAPAASAAPSAEPAAAAPAAPKLAAPAVPDAIKVPETATAVLKANAKGVQIYTCGPKKDAPGKYEWSLKAPEATLSDDSGKAFGKHYAGPTWESEDGSKVAGVMKAKVDAPAATAIPWLLIEAKSNEGQGQLSHVSFVQRVQTEGGKAPATGCDKKHDKAETKVDYSAVYYFFTDSAQASVK